MEFVAVICSCSRYGAMSTAEGPRISYTQDDIQHGLDNFLLQLIESHQIGRLGMTVLTPEDIPSTRLRFHEELIWGKVFGRLHRIKPSMNLRRKIPVSVNGLYEVFKPERRTLKKNEKQRILKSSNVR